MTLSSYSVSLAWTGSTDNSGVFSYRIEATGWGGGTTVVGQSQTTYLLPIHARVVKTDIGASNGVIHVIDAVIPPKGF